MSGEPYLNKLEKLGGFPFREGRLTPSVQATESQLAALVAQEREKMKEECKSALIAMHTDPANPATRSLRYPDEWGHFERFIKEAVNTVDALPTTKQEG